MNFTKHFKTAAAILCIFTLILPNSHAIAETEREPDKNFTFMQNIGIFDSDADGSKLITRYELGVIASDILMHGQNTSQAEDTGKFRDLDITRSAKVLPAIKYGIMSGVSSNEFAPDDNVTYAAMLKVVTALLGYSERADANGGYPYGYIGTAASLGIAPAMPESINSFVTYNTLAYSLKAAVNVNVLEKSTYDPYQSYDWVEKEPFLEHYFKIKTLSDVIVSSNTADISGYGVTEYGKIRIGKEIFNLTAETAALKDFTGYDTDIYYTENTAGEYEIICYELRQNDIVNIGCDDLIGLDGQYIKYTDFAEKTRRLKINAETSVIYNNTLCQNYDADTINPFENTYLDGSVRVIDNDKDGIYDIVLIEAYETYIVKSAANNKIYNKYRSPEVLDLSDYTPDGEYSIVNINGEYLKAEDLSPDDVLSVQRDSDGKLKMITVSIDTYIGKVGSIEKNGTRIQKITVDGKVFDCSPCLSMNEQSEKLKAGNDVKLYFNKDGKISDIECDDYVSYKLGYLVSAWHCETDENQVQLKIFTSGGKMQIFNAAKKVLMNETSGIDEKKLIDALGTENGKVKRQPLKYMLNSSGEIKSIYTCTGTDSTKDGLYMYSGFDGVTPISDIYYRESSGSFDAKLLISDKTVMFSVPTEEYRTNDELYSIASSNYFTSGTWNAPFEAYGTDADNPRAAIVIIKSRIYDFSTSEALLYKRNPDVMVVDELWTEQDSDGNEVTAVSGMCAGSSVTYHADTQAISIRENGAVIKKGDVIRFYRDTNGKITLCQLLFEGENKIMHVANPTSDTIYKYARFSYGTVVYANDEVISVKLDGSDTVESYRLSGFKVVLYDKAYGRNGSVSTGTANDIKSQKDFGGSASHVFIHTLNGDNRTMLIVNE